MVLAVKLGMPLHEVPEVYTLSDVEGLCISYADSRGSSSPLLAVEVPVLAYIYTFFVVSFDL
jgi:N-acetylgalactosamine kinase